MWILVSSSLKYQEGERTSRWNHQPVNHLQRIHSRVKERGTVMFSLFDVENALMVSVSNLHHSMPNPACPKGKDVTATWNVAIMNPSNQCTRRTWTTFRTHDSFAVDPALPWSQLPSYSPNDCRRWSYPKAIFKQIQPNMGPLASAKVNHGQPLFVTFLDAYDPGASGLCCRTHQR